MSFNIHHGVGRDGRLDLARSAALVEACAPDVVALQEVDQHLGPRSAGEDQLAWLADRLAMTAVFAPTLDLDPTVRDGARRRYGLALLSTHPVARWRSVALPRPGGGEPRALIDAVLDVEGAPLRVVTTHLQHDDASGRRAQANVVAAVADAGTEPLVVMGDLNAGPGAAELGALSATVTDCVAHLDDVDRRTYPAHRPRTSIDHVLASPELVVEAAAVVPTDASDHRPVVVDLTGHWSVTPRPGRR